MMLNLSQTEIEVVSACLAENYDLASEEIVKGIKAKINKVLDRAKSNEKKREELV